MTKQWKPTEQVSIAAVEVDGQIRMPMHYQCSPITEYQDLDDIEFSDGMFFYRSFGTRDLRAVPYGVVQQFTPAEPTTALNAAIVVSAIEAWVDEYLDVQSFTANVEGEPIFICTVAESESIEVTEMGFESWVARMRDADGDLHTVPVRRKNLSVLERDLRWS